MNSYSLKWGITIPYKKYWISIPSPYVITFKKKFPKKLLVVTSSKGKKINFPSYYYSLYFEHPKISVF